MSQSCEAQEEASHIADIFNTGFESIRFLRDTPLQQAAFPQTEQARGAPQTI